MSILHTKQTSRQSVLPEIKGYIIFNRKKQEGGGGLENKENKK